MNCTLVTIFAIATNFCFIWTPAPTTKHQMSHSKSEKAIMNQNGPEWPSIDQTDPEYPKMANNGPKRCRTLSDSPEWLIMAKTSPGWPKNNPSSPDEPKVADLCDCRRVWAMWCSRNGGPRWLSLSLGPVGYRKRRAYVTVAQFGSCGTPKVADLRDCRSVWPL